MFLYGSSLSHHIGDKIALAQLSEVAMDLDPVAAHICLLLGDLKFDKVQAL